MRCERCGCPGAAKRHKLSRLYIDFAHEVRYNVREGIFAKGRLRHKVSIVYGYLLSLGYALLCLLLAFIAYRCGVPQKYTRKLVHILVGFEWVILSHFMGPTYHFLLVCLFFLLLLLVAYCKKLMPMIASDGENALGTVYYAASMSVMAAAMLFWPGLLYPFGLAVVCTSVGDGLAGVVGQAIRRGNPRIYKNKSLFGTLSGFVGSFAASALLCRIYGIGLPWYALLAIALFAGELEAATGNGLDNITLPLGVCALAWFLLRFPTPYAYLFPILATPLLCMFVTSHHALTPRAVGAALLLDVCVSVSLGNFGFGLLLFFLAASILIDKCKKKFRPGADSADKKGACRDEWQVFANGLVPAVLAVLFLYAGRPFFAVAYVAALAEAFADTAASGIGAFSRGAYDLFRLRPCQKGMSGGVSWLGTAASLLASATVAGIALLWGKITAVGFVIALAAGFFGALFDSFLGSVWQVKYRCDACGAMTEREEHCGQPTRRVRGIPFMNNDLVNFLSGVFAAAVAAIAAALFAV